MSLRFIESKHIQVFIDPDKLIAIADGLKRKRRRFDAVAQNRICPQKDTGEADFYLEEMKELACEGGGLSIAFRLPEEEKGMKA